jgi:hypothetical protein
MRTQLRALLTIGLLLGSTAAIAQITSFTDRNLSRLAGDQSECAIAKNPANKLQLFVLCNNSGPGLFAARSIDGGVSWIFPDPADKTIADGDAGQGAAACCDPTLAWDTFGNLFISYVDQARTSIVIIRSADGGATFTNVTSFGPFCFQCPDQPTLAVGNTTDPSAPVAVWIVWHKNAPTGPIVAHGAAVTALNTIGGFSGELTLPGTNDCSYGDVAIAPSGAVVDVCQTPSTGSGAGSIVVNTKADGVGPNPFAAAVTASATNVSAFDFIPEQAVRSVDAEPGLAFDKNATSPHFGRLYLVYTNAPAVGSGDTDIVLRFSDTNGGTWSAPMTVNDDASGRGQFFPRIASNDLSGNIVICWHDSRNSATNTATQTFCTMATPAGFPAFIGPNALISDGSSTSNGSANERGDYAGLAYFQGVAHPAWSDTSNVTGDNPDGTTTFDAYTDRLSGGLAANEGDPHITTVDGAHYDFQSSGEFVALRDTDGLEIQTRQAAVATTFNPGADPHDELATCVSLNSAVAARVGKHRVTFEPNVSGVPDPTGLQFRVDGALQTLPAAGISFGPGGGSVKPAAGNGIEIDFPNGTVLFATPLFWTSQGKWYMNVDVYHTAATDGIMGAIAPGSWLPALPDGSSLGPLPATLHQRYVTLYQRFADAWRVNDRTTLFDYAPGTSTATFTRADWPKENPPCVLDQEKPAQPADPKLAAEVCHAVVDRTTRRDCIFDVTVTGETGFAKLYLVSQRLRAGATTTTVRDDQPRTQPGKPATFTATVALIAANGKPAGSVQFFVDGRRSGDPVRVNARGDAKLTTTALKPGAHVVTATYTPTQGTVFLASSSLEESRLVR